MAKWSGGLTTKERAERRAFLDQAGKKGKREEARFQSHYRRVAQREGLDPNPDDPRHHYDYRAAHRAGQTSTDKSRHFVSDYKREGHPDLIVGGRDTRLRSDVPSPPRSPVSDSPERMYQRETAKSHADEDLRELFQERSGPIRPYSRPRRSRR